MNLLEVFDGCLVHLDAMYEPWFVQIGQIHKEHVTRVWTNHSHPTTGTAGQGFCLVTDKKNKDMRHDFPNLNAEVTLQVASLSRRHPHWMRDATHNANKWSQVPFWCVLHHALLRVCSVDSTVVILGFSHPSLLRLSRSVQCGWSPKEFFDEWVEEGTTG